MRILSVELEGFQSWRSRQLVELGSRNLVAIVGPNRAGKSSLIDAVSWCLFGTSRGNSNDVIARGGNLAYVRLELEVNSSLVRVSRTRQTKGRGSARHEVMVEVADPSTDSGWREVSEKHPDSADRALVDLIGMNDELSSLTWLVRQNNYGAFAALGPSDRRSALVSAFGLHRFAEHAKRSEDLRRSAEEELGPAVWSLAHADAMIEQSRQEVLSEPELEQMSDRSSSLVEQLNSANLNLAQASQAPALAAQRAADLRNEYKLAVAAFEASRRALTAEQRNLESALAAAQCRLTEAQAAQASLPGLESAMAELTDRFADAQGRRLGCDEALAGVHEQIAALSARLATGAEREAALVLRLEQLEASHGTCAVCDSDLPESHVDALKVEVVSHLESVKQRADQLQQEFQDAHTSRDELRVAFSKADSDLAALKAELAGVETKLKSATEAAAQHLSAAADLDGSRFSLQKVVTELAALTAPVEPVEELARLDAEASKTVDDEALRQKVSELLDAQREVTVRLANHERATSTISTLQVDRAATDQKVLELRQRIADLLVIRDELRPAGIPSRILAGIVTELNADANDFMAQTADDGLTVNLSTQRQALNGSVSESVTIYAVDAAGRQVEYSTLSGSEQFRVALSLRLGLSQAIARRTGTPIRTIVIDEGWGNLDEDTRRKVAGVLTRLAQNFQILTVSHIDDVQTSFPSMVRVLNSAGTSTATVIDLN